MHEPTIALTHAEVFEFERVGREMKRAGHDPDGTMLQRIAAMGEGAQVPAREHDMATALYRAWLTFND